MSELPKSAASLPPSAPDAAASRFARHPTSLALLRRGAAPAPAPLTAALVRDIARAAGADDAGVVTLDHPDLAGERAFVLRAFPATRSLVALVVKMHPDNVRSPARSVANLEFHRAGHEIDAVAQRVAVALSERGYASINPAIAFPMEMDDFPGRAFVVSHKRVAIAAQLGKMGIHRSVIHPRFGSFVLLGTVLTSAVLDEPPPPLEFNPCLECKLCVAACPVGAIEPDGSFHFSACYDHNYREFMTGFGDFVEQIAESRDKTSLRARISASESASMWQSLAYEPSYKAAYCIAVCPAGEELLSPFLLNRAQYTRTIVKPLTDRTEPVYVVAGSDAEAHVHKRFPHKPVRVVQSSLRATTAKALFAALPLTFQRGPARGWRAVFHFDLTGSDAAQATVVIDDGTLAVHDGLVGKADVSVRSDGRLWLQIVAKERNPLLQVLRGRLRIAGQRALLTRFAACFPR